MEWIDIKKQMPELEVPVLVFGEGRISVARMDSFTTSSIGVSFVFLSGDSGYDSIWITPTHWMPLPEPPKTNEK